ncbi:hypothetical protein BX600DRAFT_468509 [Xylariales sp. PMI_506]|nr:hypothetical protein BX600DRAFT_468509 [Xylariales sp. PMI_506]
MSSSKPFPIIHINGFPGTGKLTIARQIQQIIGDRCRLVHNHLLINPADAVLRRTESGYQALRKAIRSAVFSSLADNEATHGFVYLFTDFQTGNEMGAATCAEFREAAQVRGCDLIPVIIDCDEQTNVERLQSSDRAVHHKIIDPELLRYFRGQAAIHRFEGLEASTLELDATGLGAEEAARRIIDHAVHVYPALKEIIVTEKQ